MEHFYYPPHFFFNQERRVLEQWSALALCFLNITWLLHSSNFRSCDYLRENLHKNGPVNAPFWEGEGITRHELFQILPRKGSFNFVWLGFISCPEHWAHILEMLHSLLIDESTNCLSLFVISYNLVKEHFQLLAIKNLLVWFILQFCPIFIEYEQVSGRVIDTWQASVKTQGRTSLE